MAKRYQSRSTNVFLAFLDASKAFDRVSFTVLFNILQKRGVPNYIIRLLSFWYSSQEVQAQWGNDLSDMFKVSNGVKQGGILSPYLFNVYIDELSERLNKMNVGCYHGGLKINHIFYADDMVLISPSPKGLQNLLDCCEVFASERKINFNPIKSVTMVIRAPGYSKFKFPDFYLSGSKLTEVSEFKYLGHIIQNDLKDDKDIARATRALYATGMSIVRRFSKCTYNVKLRLFKTYCGQVYTAHLWNNYNLISLGKLRVAMNTILRKLLNVPRYVDGCNYSARNLFVKYNLRNLDNLIRHQVYHFRNRISICKN